MKNTISLEKNLFGGIVEITVYDIGKEMGKDIIEDTYREGISLQKIFNFYDKSSELNLLNKKRKMKVSNELLEVIKKSIIFSELTEGRYDVSLGKTIMQRKKGKKEKSINCSYKDIVVKNNYIELKNKECLIDLGSIAKGYIVDKMIEFLKSKGVLSALIDARGDIRIFGKHAETIEVQHPRDNNKSIKTIKIKDQAIATSGDYNQYNQNYNNNHIINQGDYISVTVIAETLMDADAYATALFVSDKNKKKEILKKNTAIKTITVDRNLNKV